MKREYVEGDIYDIGGQIKYIDPALVLSLNRQKGVYQIHRVVGNRRFHVMNIKPGELDDRVLVKLRENDLQRRRLMDFIYELERSEDEAERRRARELKNQIESITLDNFDRIVGIPHFACGHWEG